MTKRPGRRCCETDGSHGQHKPKCCHVHAAEPDARIQELRAEQGERARTKVKRPEEGWWPTCSPLALEAELALTEALDGWEKAEADLARLQEATQTLLAGRVQGGEWGRFVRVERTDLEALAALTSTKENPDDE